MSCQKFVRGPYGCCTTEVICTPCTVYKQVVDSLHACVCNMYRQILSFISDVNIIEDVQLISQSVKGRGSLCIVLCPDHPNSMHLLNSEPDSKLLRMQPDLRRVTMGCTGRSRRVPGVGGLHGLQAGEDRGAALLKQVDAHQHIAIAGQCPSIAVIHLPPLCPQLDHKHQLHQPVINSCIVS